MSRSLFDMQLLLSLCWSVLLLPVDCDEYHEDLPAGSARERRETLVHLQHAQSYWLEEGRRELEEALQLHHNTRMARNIVLVIGDGMSLSTNTAGRIYKGQSQGADGVSSHLSWDKFPHLGERTSHTAITTYSLQACPRPTTWTPWCRTAQPRPSACTAG